MEKKNRYLHYIVGTAMSVTLSAAPGFAATSNLFEVKPLKGGYLVAQADTNTDNVKTDKEAKCSKKKMKDGKCGKDKKEEVKSENKGGDAKCGKGGCGTTTSGGKNKPKKHED